MIIIGNTVYKCKGFNQLQLKIVFVKVFCFFEVLKCKWRFFWKEPSIQFLKINSSVVMVI